MDGTNPKVSFIPKGSLVREESFLERRRPQSAMGFIAGTVFVLTVSAYGGLYYFNGVLNATVAEKTIEIKKAQKEFSDAPEVGEAKVFRARADLARELLNAHTVASPVFAFLSQNTTESILYDKFSFKNDSSGAVLELSGEAPTYAALAYQTDVMKKAKEILNFSVSNISLTKFGTVTFSVTMTFTSNYLLYTKNMNSSSATSPLQAEKAVATSTPVVATTTEPVVKSPAPSATTSMPATTTVATTTPSFVPPVASSSKPATTSRSIGGNWTVAPQGSATATASLGTAEKPSILQSLWLKFKFW